MRLITDHLSTYHYLITDHSVSTPLPHFRKEQEFAFAYEAQIDDPYIARSLNQNPLIHGQSSQHKTLHAMIKNVGLVWLPAADRWLTASELLTSQCFPVRASFSNNVITSCFTTPGSLSFAAPRRRTHCSVVSQMGNSMNVAVCGAMWLPGIVLVGRL